MAIPPKSYFPDRKKLKKQAAFAIGFVVSGLWMAFWSPVEFSLFFRALLLLSSLYFAPIAAYFIRLSVRRQVSIRLDELVLHDRSSMFPAAFIPWSNIASVTVSAVQKHRFVSITLNDNASFLKGRSAAYRYFANRMLAKGKPFVGIPELMVGVTTEDLVEQILYYKRNAERQVGVVPGGVLNQAER